MIKNNYSSSKKMLKTLKLVVPVATIALGWGVMTSNASAHGYVESPASRGYVGSLEKQNIGWEAALAKYGRVIDSPQSVEGPKGFPSLGPIDGQIASAGGGLGQIDTRMDAQSDSLWIKQNMRGGDNIFKWKYTAPHSTAKWHYYITKKDWDPNSPLSRSMFELIEEIPHDGTAANTNLEHHVNIPKDRSGYHIVLAVWDVADTPNAFYNVIDINLINDQEIDITPPTTPQGLDVNQVTNSSVDLIWEKSTDDFGVKEYEVYRDDKLIGITTSPNYSDRDVLPDSKYTYVVRAKDSSGNYSDFSPTLEVLVPKDYIDELPPTAPSNLHSMMVSHNSIHLMWTPSQDDTGVKEYWIYRDNIKIASVSNYEFKDVNLSADTLYAYHLKAVDFAGNISLPSKAFLVTTSEERISGDWDPSKIYTAGMTVFYNGTQYKARYWTRGDQPDSSSAWEAIDGNAPYWSPLKSYFQGEQVEYNGVIYTAKWWTLGENPENSEVWIVSQN